MWESDGFVVVEESFLEISMDSFGDFGKIPRSKIGERNIKEAGEMISGLMIAVSSNLSMKIEGVVEDGGEKELSDFGRHFCVIPAFAPPFKNGSGDGADGLNDGFVADAVLPIGFVAGMMVDDFEDL